jgi:TonB family protein
MNKATLSSPYSSVLNAQHIAIFISLTIHLGLILIFLMIPATKIMHQPQIIQIRFYNQSEFSTDSRKMSAAKLSKPDTIVLKDNIKAMALKPAHKDIPQETSVQKNSETIIAEKTLPDEKLVATQSQNTAVMPVKSVEKHGISQANFSGTSKGNIQQGIVESKFGDNGSPAFIHQEIPVYPILARRLGKEGKVLLKLLIDTNGKLQKIEVVEPAGFGFTEAALEAVKKSTYAPGYRNGERVLTKALLPVRFQLQ